MTLKPGCEHCEHVADVRGIDLTQPTPEAVEALLPVIQRWQNSVRGPRGVANESLAFIRDAIYRDGPDAQAIRDALGLRWVGTPEGHRVQGDVQEPRP